ncbi:DUF6491 family protein [Sphingorhabdus sp.]|uniref:DUF6491 family protein n=1 Tax=Sphingorhabdus sp. TaxID=1902408 RepID=UPI0032B783E9
MTFAPPALAGKAKDWDQYGQEASIAFPNHGGIRNFEANEERGLWIEDRQRRWYYAKFIGNCRGIDYANGIAFDTRGSSSFDRFGAIAVDGDYCPIESLVTAEKPLSRKERLKLRREVRLEAQKAVAPSD